MTPELKTVTTERRLRCKLTQEELLDRGQSLAYHLSDVAAIEADLASYKSSCKGRLDMANAKVQQYQQQVAEQAEWRDVECRDEYDYTTRTVISVRLDTGETLGIRPMTEDELQGELPLE